MAPFDIAPSSCCIDVRGQPVELAVAQALDLARLAETAGVALAFDVLGDIALPPVAADTANAAHLNAIAALYLASELENTDLVNAAEALCGVAMAGGLAADLGDAANDVAAFWHGRNQRASAAERHAFYVHLFGDDAQAGRGAAVSASAGERFEMAFIDLCEALYRLDAAQLPGGAFDPAQVAQVALAARQVLDILIERGAGISAFMAGDILSTVQAAIRLLQHASVQRAFGARALWDVVRTLAQRYLRTQPVIEPRVERAKAGFAVLTWLASVGPHVADGSAPAVATGDPVRVNAATWLQSSLDLSEKLGSAAGS
ncbi:hypothetical protein [Burkholderia ubonensis]|uniref:Uncharacterized protein n=1 Tax=Burkholderia ubonensis subsp. mesacidophila TaxID=265293 RepID=A0A2A4EWI2_9BURK|nr:hypothetical protein [Burkholderia ubonensis]PCE24790.1 hypothetical protein BZL54_32475 [Burkholderia ubonensis subsp. mesacidophila]